MKKTISLFLILAMALTTFTAFAEENYKASDWAKEELKKAEEMDLIPEALLTEDLTADITRAEFAAVSVKLYEKISGETAEAAENSFTDTDDEYVLKAYNLGITTGTSETEFSPKNLLNREQAASMLTRVYKKVTLKDWSIDKDADFTLEYEKPEKFSDDELISDWAVDSVYFMASKGIIKGIGDNKFAPKNITEEEKASGYANASREQAIIMAVRMDESGITVPEEKNKEVVGPDPYAAEQDTPIKTNDENTYTVAFIGGSLTEGGSIWISAVKSVLKEKMPEKEIVTINAGKGGTGSSYGAARFMEDVGNYSPDMVIIEFAVNDTGSNEEQSKIYMESMVRQSKKLAKEPVIIFLYAPRPCEKDSNEYNTWVQGVQWKEEIAKHYGIKSINVYDYMQDDYNRIKDQKGYKSFTDYLSAMYNKSDSGFDVHGGYVKYSEAIVKAFTEDYEECMSAPQNVGVYCRSQKKIVEATYKQLFIDSSAMNYSGKWNTYIANNKFQTSDAKATINDKHYSYPFFSHGIKQIINDTAAFGFMTKAEAFCLNYPASSAGSAVKVYIDGTESGTLSCYSQYHGVNYTSKWISLPNDGKEHKVIMVVDHPSIDNYVFRFGSVIERYAK
ncbi:MAG: S-layer homology domain-containing protein [Clostridia bacterium]|nr:S-layer homology domain-containing protein [Clostridia bacterium]